MPKVVTSELGQTGEPDSVEEDMVPQDVEEGVTVDDDDPDFVEEEDNVPVEEMDPESEVWEGGPLAKEIVAWKEQYGRLYITTIDYDLHIVWRPIKRSEYKDQARRIEEMLNSGKVSQLDANMLSEELVAETCMLYPKYDRAVDGNAGVPDLIARQVMEASGFTSLDIRVV